MLQLRAVMLQSGRAKEMFKRIKMSIDGGMHVERYIHVRTSTSSMADCALWTVDDWPLFVVCQSVWALLHNYGVDWDTGIAEVGNIMGELETSKQHYCFVRFFSAAFTLLYCTLATLWTRINMLYGNPPKEIPHHSLHHRDDWKVPGIWLIYASYVYPCCQHFPCYQLYWSHLQPFQPTR